MGRLVTEQRFDKNGRLVTRHVLADRNPARSINDAPVPATPVASTPQTREEYAQEITDYLLEASDQFDRDATARLFAKDLTLYSLRLVHSRMHDFSERDGDLFLDALDKLILGSVEQGDSQAERENEVAALVEVMPVITKLGDPSMSSWEAISIAKGAGYGAQANYIIIANHIRVPEGHVRAFRYLAWEYMVTGECRKRRMDAIKQDALWLEANMDSLSDYREMIKERGTVDQEFLDELLVNNSAPALGEGIL
jgi:hypothetical protein